MSKVGRPALNKKVKIKSIKLDEKELPFWDSKAVNDFLQGKDKSKELLKKLYDFMRKMEFKENLTPEDIKFLELIDKEVKS